VKWGEVVDRGDRGAGMRVEQTPIAGDMEDIETMCADEAWQKALMPQNVCDGMSKAFRHGNQFESAIEFLEERQVAFEDKSRQVVITGDGEQGAQQSEDVLSNAGLPPLDDGGGDAYVH